jgi:hypothetical protein
VEERVFMSQSGMFVSPAAEVDVLFVMELVVSGFDRTN